MGRWLGGEIRAAGARLRLGDRQRAPKRRLGVGASAATSRREPPGAADPHPYPDPFAFLGLELVDARRVVSSRDRAPFKDLADALTRLHQFNPNASDVGLAVATRYFVVEGIVSYGPARLAARALLKREATRLEILWIKEIG